MAPCTSSLLQFKSSSQYGQALPLDTEGSFGTAAWKYEGASRWTSSPLPTALSAEPLGQHGQLHSQAGQDWIVQSILQCQTGGYFLDLAANDAEIISNTLMLERDFQWNGLCIEANPQYADKYARRKCQLVMAAVGSPTDTAVEFASRGVYGGIVDTEFDNKEAEPNKTLKLYTVALAEVLRRFKAPRIIDYLSLDVEGAESMVMQGFPWSEYKFKVLTIERPKPDLVSALTSHGYESLRKNSFFDDTTWINTELMHDEVAQLERNFANGAMAAQQTCLTALGYPHPPYLSE